MEDGSPKQYELKAERKKLEAKKLRSQEDKKPELPAFGGKAFGRLRFGEPFAFNL
jgi:hypothetical protein